MSDIFDSMIDTLIDVSGYEDKINKFIESCREMIRSAEVCSEGVKNYTYLKERAGLYKNTIEYIMEMNFEALSWTDICPHHILRGERCLCREGLGVVDSKCIKCWKLAITGEMNG